MRLSLSKLLLNELHKEPIFEIKSSRKASAAHFGTDSSPNGTFITQHADSSKRYMGSIEDQAVDSSQKLLD